MNSSFVVTWKELLIAGIIVLVVYIAKMLLLKRSDKPSRFSFWQRRAENQELIALKNQLAELEIRLARLESSDSADNLGGTASTTYGKAFNLAKQGMDVAQVAANCGISRSEAELIVAMQRKDLH